MQKTRIENEEIETKIVDQACAIFHSMRELNTHQARKHFERRLRPYVRRSLLFVRAAEANKPRTVARIVELLEDLNAANEEIDKLEAEKSA